MDFKFRTFKESDQGGILKTYTAAFCKSRICQPSNPEFWEWKYGLKRPNYDPRGYQICEYKGRIVGTIQCTIRTMKFNGEIYRVAGIDDVATCPVLEKRGIGRKLMENAVKYMEDEQKVDLSVLSADPRGHARKIYWHLGYKYLTYFSIGFKSVSVRNSLFNFTPITPLAIPFRIYGAFKTCRWQHKSIEDLKLELVRKNQDAFRRKLNENYDGLFSFDDYNEDYWNWYHVTRPRSVESVILAAKENKKIVGGGVITRSHLMLLNSKKWYPLYILTELFVDKDYRGRGIASYLLSHLERITKSRGIGVIITQFHRTNHIFRKVLKKLGYFYVDDLVLQMIKPISDRAKELFKRIEGKEFNWKVPWEQMGY